MIDIAAPICLVLNVEPVGRETKAIHEYFT